MKLVPPDETGSRNAHGNLHSPQQPVFGYTHEIKLPIPQLVEKAIVTVAAAALLAASVVEGSDLPQKVRRGAKKLVGLTSSVVDLVDDALGAYVDDFIKWR